MKKCINRRCNAQLEDAFRFCPFCGKPQDEKSSSAAPKGPVLYTSDRKTKQIPIPLIPFSTNSAIMSAVSPQSRKRNALS